LLVATTYRELVVRADRIVWSPQKGVNRCFTVDIWMLRLILKRLNWPNPPAAA